MKLKKVILLLLLVDMVAFSAYVMWEVGYMGIWQAGLSNLGAMQILADLAICCVLLASWVVVDARKRGVNPWPWVVATLFVGSISPLLYLIVREYSKGTYPAGAVSA